MSTTTITTTEVGPVCEECATPTRPVGGDEHPYWGCTWCGGVLPRNRR